MSTEVIPMIENTNEETFYLEDFNNSTLPEWTKNEARVAVRANIIFRTLLDKIYKLVENKHGMEFEDYKHMLDMLLFGMKEDQMIADYNINILSIYDTKFRMDVQVVFNGPFKGNCMILRADNITLVKDELRHGYMRFE